MNKRLHYRTLWLPVALLLGAFAVGLVIDQPAWTIALTMTGWSLFQAWQFWAFQNWLATGRFAAPDLTGIWDDVAALLYRNRRSAQDRTRRILVTLRQLQSFINSMPDAVIITDENGVIEWTSPRATTYLGLTQQDIGKTFTALVRHPHLVALMQNQLEEPVIEIPSVAERHRILEIRVTDLEAGRQMVLARDTTQLSQLLTMRQDFVANVSHELRTPLTVIHGYVEALTEDALPPEEVRRILRRMVGPSQRMAHLVEDLLMLSRLESGALPAISEVPAVPVRQQLVAMIDDLRGLPDLNPTLNLDADPDLLVRGIESELYSAFHNLITNAIHYSPDGASITVTWAVDASTGGAEFAVVDQGVGIAPEHLGRITERFYRVDPARSRTAGGTGLGLAIVKHVLRRHDSELLVRSALGRGSRFSFVIPARRVVRAKH